MNFEIANEKAVRFLTASLKTEYEVRQKLIKLNCENEIIDKVITHLKEILYINDEEYVNAYIRQCKKLPKYSIYEITNKLRQKGIDDEKISRCKTELESIEYELELVNKIKNKKTNIDPLKLKAYLYRRGFKNF